MWLIELIPIDIFQEHKYAIQKLRAAYYSNATTIDAIKSANIDLMSDMTFSYGVLKGVISQAIVNSKSERKNTFLFRFDPMAKQKNTRSPVAWSVILTKIKVLAQIFSKYCIEKYCME